MPNELPLPRVVVTGNNAAGRSCVVFAGPPHRVRTVEERPGYRVSNLWTVVGAPAPLGDPDRIIEVQGVSPPASGNVIRIIDYPPEPKDPAALTKMFDAISSKLFPDSRKHRAEGTHPGMHTTETIDYAIVLHGEIYAVMEEEEILMRAGDVLIQRGTAHAWSNRSNDFARLCIVLIDGKR